MEPKIKMTHTRLITRFFVPPKWLGILLVLGFIWGIGISTFYRGVIGPKERTDLTVYLAAGQMVAEGRASNLYMVESHRHWHYVYPPLLAVLLAPVAKWPLTTTVSLAYLLSIACLIGTVVLSRHFRGSARPAPGQIALAMFFCLPVLMSTLTRGQFGVITLFFMAAIFTATWRDTRP